MLSARTPISNACCPPGEDCFYKRLLSCSDWFDFISGLLKMDLIFWTGKPPPKHNDKFEIQRSENDSRDRIGASLSRSRQVPRCQRHCSYIIKIDMCSCRTTCEPASVSIEARCSLRSVFQIYHCCFRSGFSSSKINPFSQCGKWNQFNRSRREGACRKQSLPECSKHYLSDVLALSIYIHICQTLLDVPN